jgi:hypothetical protein
MDLLTPYSHKQLELQAITALSLIYTLNSAPLHTHWNSQSPVVVSWQRIYQSRCKFQSHVKSSWHRLTLFLPFFAAAISETGLYYSRLLLYASLYSIPSSDSIALQNLRTDPTENIVACCQKCLFSGPLPSNRRPIFPRVCFCGNVFSEPFG